MTELISIPASVLIAGVGTLVSTGIVIGAVASKYVTKKDCEKDKTCCKEQMNNKYGEIFVSLEKIENRVIQINDNFNSRLDTWLMEIKKA